MKKRIFLIHGWEGSPQGGWFPWLKKELEAKGMEGIALAMPNSDHPQMEEWVDHLRKVVGEVDEDCYFVGHSLGCITILRYLERLEPGKKVGGVVLVAGFTSNLGFEALTNFFPDHGQLAWDKIKSHCDRFVAIHSDDDPLVSAHYGERFFQRYLGAEFILEHKKKHFSAGDGIVELPVVMKALIHNSH